MNNYIFILGNHPKLSIAEIKSLLNFMDIQAFFKSVSAKALLVNTKENLDCQKILDKLGGTIKIAKVFKEFNGKYNFLYSSEYIDTNEKRLNFGISFYDTDMKKIDILNCLKKIKKNQKNKGVNINYVISKTIELSPSQVFNKLSRDKGIEHIVVSCPKINYLAQTQAIFNLKKYSKIDYAIPYSDPKKGMLPPKLANMLINLSLSKEFSKEMFIYDPFCGNGRVVIQSLLAGFSAYGSDIDKKSANDSEENIKWIIDKYNLKDAEYKIFSQNATEKNKLKNNTVTNLVTEPELGTAYKQMPQTAEVSKNFKELENKYIKSFAALSKILKNKSKTVIVFPKIGGVSLLAKIIDKFRAMGYHKISEFEYSREYQIVKRHIGVFIFNK